MKKTLLSQKRKGNLLAARRWADEWERRCMQRDTGQADDEFYRMQFIRYHGGKRSDDVYAAIFEQLFEFVEEDEPKRINFTHQFPERDCECDFDHFVFSEDTKPTEIRLDRQMFPTEDLTFHPVTEVGKGVRDFAQAILDKRLWENSNG